MIPWEFLGKEFFGKEFFGRVIITIKGIVVDSVLARNLYFLSF